MADTVAEGLRELAMAVDVVHDGEAALEQVRNNRYDVAVLDRDMPGRTGDDVCRHLLEGGERTRVLLLTARCAARTVLTRPRPERELVFVPDAVHHLKEFTGGRQDSWLFVGPLEGPLRQSNFPEPWRTAIKKRACPMCVHDLRHTGHTHRAHRAHRAHRQHREYCGQPRPAQA